MVDRRLGKIASSLSKKDNYCLLQQSQHLTPVLTVGLWQHAQGALHGRLGRSASGRGRVRRVRLERDSIQKHT